MRSAAVTSSTLFSWVEVFVELLDCFFFTDGLCVLVGEGVEFEGFGVEG